MIKHFKRPLSLLLATLMVVSLFTIIPISASAAAVTPKYKITINGKAVVNSTALPYTTNATNLKNKAGYSSYSVTFLKVYKAKDNIGTISGQNFTVNKSGSEQLDIGLKKGSTTGHITPNVVCTPLTPCVCEATGYTGNYDGEPHTIEGLTVTSPESGATVKYGTVSGTYNLTEPPTFTEVGTHTVYYQVSASGWVTKTGSLNVNILSNGYTVTWKNGDTVIKTDTDVAEDTTPVYDGSTPTKAADDDYTYTFVGWSDGTNTYAPDALPKVNGDITYTAVFDQVRKPDYITGGNVGYVFNDTLAPGEGDSIAEANDIDELFNLKMLGVQKKAKLGDDDFSKSNDVRFITVVNNDILKDADEYGYLIAKVSNKDAARNAADSFVVSAADDKKLKKLECTGTDNKISGNYGDHAADTAYKYVTASVNGIGDDDTVAARFYLRKGNDYYYADYTNDQGSACGVCAAKFSELLA